ncbi:MAG: hypothetical protein ABJ239_03275 [Erythrobacter sp.]
MGAAPSAAQAPVDRPFSMRGVELGTTIDEFKDAAIPNDEDEYTNLQSGCSNDTGPKGDKFYLSSDDKAAGIVECKWYSSIKSLRIRMFWEHWIKIGKGSGIPTFRFIERDNELRLFEISFYANNQYYPDIHDALTRGYGPAEETVSPFQTKAGADFTSLRSVWNNGLSKITLTQRCEHLERYCLVYEHSELSEKYRAIKERQAQDAAKRI